MRVSFKDAYKKLETRVIIPIRNLGKTRLILLVTFFILFAITGYLTGQVLGKAVVGSALITTPTPNPVEIAGYANQHNFLFIHADDLSKKPPKLISVKIGLITDFEGEPFIHFKSLYPNANAPFMQTIIVNAFNLGPDGKPLPGFFTQINRYNIKYDGFILIDDSGATILTSYIDGTNTKSQSTGAQAEPTTNPGAADNTDMYTVVEAKWIQTLCTFLGQRNTNLAPYQKWSEVMPDHVRTNLNFDTLALTWERLTTAPKPTRCKLID
jgi:hypothetical protein